MSSESSLDVLRLRLAERLDSLTEVEDWNQPLVTAMLAVFDLYFDDHGAIVAPVLELVKR